MTSNQKSLGQYFTPRLIAEFMVDLISKDHNAQILEPAAGRGVFLDVLAEKGYKNIDAFEIDKHLKNESSVKITYDDFITLKSEKKYDVIIGNPPYVRWKHLNKQTQHNLSTSKNLSGRINGLMDLLHGFILRSLDSLKEDGELIFITPTFWAETLHASGIRKEMLQIGELETVVLLDEAKIFDGVSSSFLIFKFVRNKKNRKINVVHVRDSKKINDKILQAVRNHISQSGKLNNSIGSFKQSQFDNNDSWKFMPNDVQKKISDIIKACSTRKPLVKAKIGTEESEIPLIQLLRKNDLEALGMNTRNCQKAKFGGLPYFVEKNQRLSTKQANRYTRLEDICDIGNGMVSGLDKAFKADPKLKFSNKEKKKFINVVKAYNLKKYKTEDSTPYIFVNDIENEKELKKFPNIYGQLSRFRKDLDQRYDYNKKIRWWEWVFLRNKQLLEKNNEKIFVPCKERINKKGFVRFSRVSGNYYATQDVTTIAKKPVWKEDLKYILAILNSNLIFYWLKHMGLARGGVVEFSERPLAKIPIKLIDWDNQEEIKIYNEILSLVNSIIDSGQDDEKSSQLENLVKKLYGISA